MSDNSATLEAGRLLFAEGAQFFAGADSLARLPPVGAPEVALVGRSNVGKSSLINALTGQKVLARVSNTPGRTQQLNFFNVQNRLWLVDLPGYGYAEAPKAKKANWQDLLKTYLQTRTTLRRLLLLIDGRHGPLKRDLEWLELLREVAVPFQVVLTKADKISNKALQDSANKTLDAISKHPAALTHIIATSAETGLGFAELRATLLQIAE